jgi:predicted transposase/invertase (TIGR01784 family)
VNIHELMDLKIDYAFKQLFGNPKNKRITIEFLNAMLGKLRREKIFDVEFVNNELGQKYGDDKLSRLDVLAKTSNNEFINIEIQFNNKYNMVKRSLYYWGKVYSDQLLKSDGYVKLRPVIMIK